MKQDAVEDKKSADGPAAGYWERPYRLRTWSDEEVNAYYEAADVPPEPQPRPGEYPYLRGLHRDGYRGRLWTRREIAGFGEASDTNQRFRYLLEQGATGLNCHFDLPSHLTSDPDHPLADGEIGGAGPSICRLEDMRKLMHGIRADEVSMSLISSTMGAIVFLPMYAMVAEEVGVAAKDIRGTIQNDPLHARYCGYEASCPIDASLRTASDLMAYSQQHLPNWYTNNINMYDLREHGITAAQELAFGFGLAIVYLDESIRRGASVEQAARKMAFYCSLHNDLLEEVAKLRAARVVWSRLLVERYGLDVNSKACQFRIGSQTAGSTLIPQQPLNNIVRIAYQALAGALAGVSSIHCCGFDEAIGLPSPLAHTVAVRTQQILAYETGVPLVADPLGGSYYVESLTARLIERTFELMQDIEGRGGMLECIRSSWLHDQLASASLREVEAIETGDKRVVGRNWAIEEPASSTPGGIHVFSTDVNDRRIREIVEFKAGRDRPRLEARLRELHTVARDQPMANVIPNVQAALRSDATLGEIVGTIRVAYGLPYDPVAAIESPFSFS